MEHRIRETERRRGASRWDDDAPESVSLLRRCCVALAWSSFGLALVMSYALSAAIGSRRNESEPSTYN